MVSHFADVPSPTDEMGTSPSVLGLVVFSDADPVATPLGLVHPHGRWIDWEA